MKKKNIYIASDHAGFLLKKKLIKRILEKYKMEDLGVYSETSVDYPDYAHKLALALKGDTESVGIVLCGSGNGINMTVNKYAHIRSALCWNEEIAKFARLHNDSNVLALPTRFISEEIAIKITTIFLNTKFEGGRHLRRVNKISVC